jgi:acyl carrier protein
MTKPEILLEVTNILHRTVLIELTPITEETNFRNDLAIDSLDQLEIVMECEKSFNVFIKDEIADKIRTVGDLVNTIHNYINF